MLKNNPLTTSSFKEIIDNNYAYVDKTRFLEVYENHGYPVSMLLRPRRFGKTMFAELLRYYYDISLKDEGDRLFCRTYIASHPTPLKNSFHVLKFDFSGGYSSADGTASAAYSTAEEALSFFKRNIVNGIVNFYRSYPKLLPGFLKAADPEDGYSSVISYYNGFKIPAAVLQEFLTYINGMSENLSGRLMVIIDEYDNFTNDILTGSSELSRKMEIARIHSEFSTFYGVLRNFKQMGIISKIYVTGVLPITIDTAISGFVSEHLTSDPQFNELAGFTDEEVMDLLRQTVDFEKCPFSPEELRAEIKRRYDGYRFADNAENTVYNAAMCLNFISELIENDYREIPSFKLFSKANIDYDKLCGCFMLINEQDRKQLIEDLNNRRPVASNIGMAVKLSAEHKTLNYHEGAAILYHLGFLTMMSEEEKKRTPNCSLNVEYLTIPNEYFRDLFARFLLTRSPAALREIESIKDLGMMAVSNDISILSAMLHRIAGGFTQTDVSREGENQIALTIYTALSLAAGGSFNVTKEYAVKHDGSFVFEDGLNEDEYCDVPEDEPEDKPAIPADSDGVSPEDSEDLKAALELKELFGAEVLNPAVSPDTLRGRADLVAINKGKGPSYIFEFKYKRNSKVREKTRVRVIKTLYERAVKQLNFYVTDDALSKISDLRRYVIMYVYGRFIIKEI